MSLKYKKVKKKMLTSFLAFSVLVASPFTTIAQTQEPQKKQQNQIILESEFKVELPKNKSKKIKLKFSKNDSLISRHYANKGVYLIYENIIYFDKFNFLEMDVVKENKNVKTVKSNFHYMGVNDKNYVFLFTLLDDGSLKYYININHTNLVYNLEVDFPPLAVDKDTIFEIKPKKGEESVYILHIKNENEERNLEVDLYKDIIDFNEEIGVEEVIKNVKIFNRENTSNSYIYYYDNYDDKIVSRNPSWNYPLSNVSCYQFIDYKNKKNEMVSLFFVTYKNGSAGFFILPGNSENEMLYYEFEGKHKVDEKRCMIFDGVDVYDNEEILYFRVLEPNGETVNYGVPLKKY